MVNQNNPLTNPDKPPDVPDAPEMFDVKVLKALAMIL